MSTRSPVLEEPPSVSTGPACRFCAAQLRHTFVDLGLSPLCQTQIPADKLNEMEPFFPLHVFVCERCFLVQLDEFVAPDKIFSAEYPYFSSYSDSWVAHAKRYAEHMRDDFGIGTESFVVEIASNDGYLLQHFLAAGTRCLGVEPALSVAEAARARGVPTVTRFFGAATAASLRESDGPANLVLGNNVLAHVPDLNDFVEGVRILLREDDGIATFEFPHLMRLEESNQFDTIYHEHFSYFSFTTVREVFKAHGLRLFAVRELETHGGSLRIYACNAGAKRKDEDSVRELEEQEIAKGYRNLHRYADFSRRVHETKRRLLDFLIQARDAGKKVVGYGAPGKGNTLLNYCGIRRDFLDYTVDRNPWKQGTYTPGTRIPIFAPEKILQTKPDYVLILPWNLAKEISANMAGISAWGGRFVVPIPSVRVLDPLK